VEPDGSVGPVRIVRSLDAVYGLDDEAIRAVKQWRFLPGTREGAPVRVAVTIEMSFTIRGRGDSPTANPGAPIMGWPDSFADATEVPVFRPSGWSEDAVQTSLVEVRFAYPPGWSILKATDADRLVTLHADDARGNRTITISQRGPAPFSLVAPLPESTLKTFVLGQGGMPAPATNVQLVRSGQVQRPDGLWLWFEMVAPSIDVPSAPAAIAEHLRSAHDGMRMWAFVTTAGGQSLSVFCSVLHAAKASDADKQEDIHRAGLEFGAMLRRMSINAR
jgi:TonB family protein